jgi:CDP-glycerol glycerophosphotransferase (TagB/SpsB family)
MSALRFDFFKDRLIKAAKLPWFTVLAILARVIPNDPNLWVFGRKAGFGEGPLAVYGEVVRQRPEVRAVWLTVDERDDRLAQAHGIRPVRRDSLAATWLCLRASHGVMTHGFSDLCGPAIWHAFVIQLWHGTPLKRIGKDAVRQRKVGFPRLLNAMASVFEHFWNTHITVFVAASELSREHFVTATGLPREKVIACGDPRCDLIVPNARVAKETLAQIALSVGAGPTAKILLFAPTWRDDGSDPFKPSQQELDAVYKMLCDIDGVLLMRAHPHSDGFAEWGQVQRVAFIPPHQFPDLTSLLGGVDVLITDYSGVATDYTILHRPIIFFAPDLKAYEDKRGLYMRYEELTSGEWCSTWEDVSSALLALSRDADAEIQSLTRVVEPLRAMYIAYPQAGSAKRLLDWVHQ